MPMHHEPKKTTMVAVSAPSGAGKTTVCRALLEQNPNYRLSISATTRKPRPNEREGVHYFFLSKEEFMRRVKNEEFLEYQEVHGNLYGTLKSQVQELMEQGFTVLFDIDVYGALNIKKQYPEALLVFLMPPSLEELKKRLRERKTDNEEEIEKRLRRLPEEYAQAEKFDYIVINRDLAETVRQIQNIIKNHQKQRQNVSQSTV
ncbi:MAG: guanylate kinase [Calditrichia bacterium]